jgi:hypothetical protein
VKKVGRPIGVIFWCFLVLLNGIGTSPASASEFTVHASAIPEYMIKTGATLDESTGLMMEIAAGAFKRAKLKVNVAAEVPWARAQADAIDEPGSILLLFARTPAREAKWQWVSVAYTAKLFAYTMKDKPAYASFEEMKAKKAHIGIKLGGPFEAIFKGIGVTTESVPTHQQNFLKLMTDRLDVLVCQGMEVYPAVQSVLDGPMKDAVRRRVPDLRRTSMADLPLWFVTSLKTSANDARLLKDAIEEFKRTPEYGIIVDKYEARFANLADLAAGGK